MKRREFLAASAAALACTARLAADEKAATVADGGCGEAFRHRLPEFEPGSRFNRVAWFPSGRGLALNRKGPGRVVLIDTDKGTLVDTALALADVQFIGCAEAQRSVIVVTTRGEAHRYLIDSDSQELIQDFKDRVWTAALSPRGSQVAVACGTDSPTLRVWDVETRKEIWARKLKRLEIPQAVDFSYSGKLVAFGTSHGYVYVCNTSDGRVWHEIHPPADERTERASVAAVRFLKSDDLVAMSYYGPGISVCTLANETHRFIRNSHGRHHRTLGVSPCHELIAAGDELGVITIYDSAAAKELMVIDAHETSIEQLVFSLDDQTLASISSGNKLLLTKSSTFLPQ